MNGLLYTLVNIGNVLVIFFLVREVGRGPSIILSGKLSIIVIIAG
jgi:hypothetical protein